VAVLQLRPPLPVALLPRQHCSPPQRKPTSLPICKGKGEIVTGALNRRAEHLPRPEDAFAIGCEVDLSEGAGRQAGVPCNWRSRRVSPGGWRSLRIEQRPELWIAW